MLEDKSQTIKGHTQTQTNHSDRLLNNTQSRKQHVKHVEDKREPIDGKAVQSQTEAKAVRDVDAGQADSADMQKKIADIRGELLTSQVKQSNSRLFAIVSPERARLGIPGGKSIAPDRHKSEDQRSG